MNQTTSIHHYIKETQTIHHLVQHMKVGEIAKEDEEEIGTGVRTGRKKTSWGGGWLSSNDGMRWATPLSNVYTRQGETWR